MISTSTEDREKGSSVRMKSGERRKIVDSKQRKWCDKICRSGSTRKVQACKALIACTNSIGPVTAKFSKLARGTGSEGERRRERR
jgi:hypothetical protein